MICSETGAQSASTDEGGLLGQRILLVDDERPIVESLRYALEKEGYDVLEASDGSEALALAEKTPPDLVLLDIMLPGMSGFEVCRVLRKESTVPILILTARTDESDRVVGLDLGADDYIIKPFSVREVLARVRAALRRIQAGTPSGEILRAANVTMDLARHEVRVGDRSLRLPLRQFDVLKAFLANPGRVLTRAALLQHAWGHDFYGDDRTVDVHIRWLRKTLQEAGAGVAIQTVRGVGYKLEE